jgi:hypothetical protein
MRNLLIVFGLLFCSVLLAQERTVDLYNGRVLDLETTRMVGYNGTTSDRLIPTTRDTIDYWIAVKNQSADPLHFYAAFQFDTIAGADTTIAITVQYKKFTTEDYSDLIASALTAAIGAEAIVAKTSLGVTTEFTATGAQANSSIGSHVITTTAYDISGYDEITTDVDTLAIPEITNTAAAATVTNGNVTTTRLVNTALYYGYLRFRLILPGDDTVGTGIKVERIDLQFYN